MVVILHTNNLNKMWIGDLEKNNKDAAWEKPRLQPC